MYRTLISYFQHAGFLFVSQITGNSNLPVYHINLLVCFIAFKAVLTVLT